MIKRTTINQIEILLKENPNWKVLDIGCGYRANKYANTIADVQDLSHVYPDKKFIKINEKILPFKDNSFDFVFASHVIEHVEDFEFFISELERVSKKGYIELPSRLGDNIVFENTTDHIWWFIFDDINKNLVASKKNQILDPFLAVSTAKLLEQYFRESLIIELFWENKIDYKIDINLENKGLRKISFLQIIKKYFSKLIRKKFSK